MPATVSEHWSQESTMQHDQNILWENLQMMPPACPSGCRSIQHQTLKAHGYGAALPLMDTVIHSHSLVTTIHCHHRSNAKYSISSINETALRETQTLHAGCKAKPKMFADPLPGAAGRPKFNQLEMVTTCTYRPSLMKIDARNFELSW